MSNSLETPQIRRHTAWGMFMHWFNAGCWFFLLATGLGLISNPELQPLGQWYPNALRAVFGGGAGLLIAHEVVAFLWLAVWIYYLARFALSQAAPFVRSIFTMDPNRDLEWMVKKNIQMVLGYKAMAKLVKPLGWDGVIPPQEYYNAGQKLAAQGIIAGALALVVSGLVMFLSQFSIQAANVWWVQWSITIHYLAAGITTGLLILHIYMAAISREERPAFFSMFSGRVPAEYARHHHQLWYDQIKDNQGGTR